MAVTHFSSDPNPKPIATVAALLALIAVSGVMLASLFAGVAPHPPATTPLFAMGPFLGGSLALGVAAAYLAACGDARWPTLALAFAATGLVSFGPQKYLDAAFPEIWPAVIVAQLAIAAIIAASIRAFLQARKTESKA